MPDGNHSYRRYDTAAERLPDAVRRRLERTLERTVVVLDDSQSTRTAVEELIPEGWDVTLFESPIEALAHMARHHPVVVVSDLKMPATDGVTFLQEVAAAMPTVRRVLMSATRSTDDFVRAVNEVGVYRFVDKPVSPEVLREVLEGALAQRRRELAVEFLIEDVKAQNKQLERAGRALEQRESHLLHSERLAVLGRLTDGLGVGIQPLLEELRVVVATLHAVVNDATNAELLDMGHDAVDAIWDIIDDINRFTRDDVLMLDREQTDMEALIRRAVRFASFDRRLRQREVVIEAQSGVQARVDGRRIRQVLLNLLRNAADATGPGALIEVALSRDGSDVVIDVRDDGAGMPAQMAALVFEDFFSTKGDAGLGLGLSLCRTIVEQHGGTISCDTELGRGTTFTVRLPRAA